MMLKKTSFRDNVEVEEAVESFYNLYNQCVGLQCSSQGRKGRGNEIQKMDVSS